MPKTRKFRQHPKIKAAADDIPLALRTHHGTRRGNPKGVSAPLGAVLLSLAVVGAVVTFLLLGPLRTIVQPPLASGLREKIGSDGRLLGHFPYPEAVETTLVAVAPGMKLRQDAAKSFFAMQRAAAAEGISLTLLSAFRSIDLQKQLFFDVKAQRNQTSLDRAKVSAPPGFSEHSTGYAIDIGDSSQPQNNLSPTFINTRAYRWLTNNAARFQFVLSFPKDNPQGVSFEPWHWRYEGTVEALRLFEPAQRLRSQATP